MTQIRMMAMRFFVLLAVGSYAIAPIVAMNPDNKKTLAEQTYATKKPSMVPNSGFVNVPSLGSNPFGKNTNSVPISQQKPKKSNNVQKVDVKAETQAKAAQVKLVERDVEIKNAEDTPLREVVVSRHYQNYLNNKLPFDFYDNSDLNFYEEDPEYNDVFCSGPEPFEIQELGAPLAGRLHEKHICNSSNQTKRLEFYLRHKQGNNLDELLSEHNVLEDFATRSIVQKLQDVRSGKRSTFVSYPAISRGKMDYASYFLAKKGGNTEFISNYLERWVLTRLDKEEKNGAEPLGKASLCNGWDKKCQGDDCTHFVDINDKKYRRFFNVNVTGKQINNKKTALTSRIVKSYENGNNTRPILHEDRYKLRTYVPTQETLSKYPTANALVSLNRYKTEYDNNRHIGYKSHWFVEVGSEKNKKLLMVPRSIQQVPSPVITPLNGNKYLATPMPSRNFPDERTKIKAPIFGAIDLLDAINKGDFSAMDTLLQNKQELESHPVGSLLISVLNDSTYALSPFANQETWSQYNVSASAINGGVLLTKEELRKAAIHCAWNNPENKKLLEALKD